MYKYVVQHVSIYARITQWLINDREISTLILNDLTKLRELSRIVLTCQGHFPNELRFPPTIRDSGNNLLPHTARTSIVEFKPFNKFANLNDTAMLENESSILVQLDEPVPSRAPLPSMFFLPHTSNYAYDSASGLASEKDHRVFCLVIRDAVMNGNDSSMLPRAFLFTYANTFFHYFLF